MIALAYSAYPVNNSTSPVADIAHSDMMEDLLSAAVDAVIAENLGVSLDQVRPDCRLTADLGMTAYEKKQLQQELAFIFNSNDIDIADTMTVKGVLEQVANIEFSRLGLHRPD